MCRKPPANVDHSILAQKISNFDKLDFLPSTLDLERTARDTNKRIYLSGSSGSYRTALNGHVEIVLAYAQQQARLTVPLLPTTTHSHHAILNALYVRLLLSHIIKTTNNTSDKDHKRITIIPKFLYLNINGRVGLKHYERVAKINK
ncbi:hypothetical protein AG1IA_01587 [Rhizoctonia solani AG-1 IA]|uniref:Uncharacterized protein n=1 Tax=Thanatephorus cucumeris (strain AG1-IA) TaxID=983506 RepID=L8X2D0_THACA|nr:hypothetical protein AG1IA_01587 [Rhizoctonia solani AG-1 IA]